jgi:sialic acid synthase SpsE
MKRTIILDCGSGETLTDGKTKNNKHVAIEIIDKIKAIDSGKHRIVFKFQLFKEPISNLEPLNKVVFDFIYRYCISHGYECTSSVFDQESLDFLKNYDTPFIKIACRDYLYHFISQIDKPLVSVPNSLVAGALMQKYPDKNIKFLYCIPEYPATLNAYRSYFGDVNGMIGVGISDHSIGLDIIKNHEPLIYEKHIVLERGKTDDPYGDDFCAVPEDFEEIL